MTFRLKATPDYYPFGMAMPGRSLSLSNYRFGFNGKENDDEVKGIGNSLDFGGRIYDPRLGVFYSLDAYSNKFPSESNYSFASLNPISFIDKDGQYTYSKNNEKNYSKSYPLFTKYLSENVKQDVMNSQNIMAGLLKYSGGTLNAGEVNKAVTWKSGPNIEIVDKPGGSADATGSYDGKTNTIFIRKDVIEKFENASKDDKEAALFGAFEELLHETVHHGDELNGKMSRGMDERDPGDEFYNEVFDSKKVELGNGQTDWTGQGHNPHDIKQAKEVIQMNKKEGKSDVIPTIPQGDSKKPNESNDEGND